MSFTEYTRHMYIFPKGVRVRVDLPLNSSRVFVAPIVITKIERNTREGSVYILTNRSKGRVRGCTKEFRCVTEAENRERVCKRGTWCVRIVVRQQI